AEAPALVRLRLVDETVDLRALGLAEDPRPDARPAELVGRREDPRPVDDEHGVERDLAPLLLADELDLELLARLHLVLLAAGSDDGVHGRVRSLEDVAWNTPG